MPLNRLGSVENNSLLTFVTKYCQNKHENYSHLPQLLPFIWMGCFFSSYRISASRTTWNVACYFTTPNPASDISCSISSPLAPFLQKTNLQNHSMASAQGHKLFWHQQPAKKCVWHQRHWITASQMAGGWKGYKFCTPWLRNIFLQLQGRKDNLNIKKKCESLQAQNR